MNIAEKYQKEFVISFEVFPPKTDRGMENLVSALKDLKKYEPGFISVTYGAGGSTREKTLDIAMIIRDQLHMLPLVHFTCVGAGRDEIREYLEHVKELGLDNIMALRGDPPAGETGFTPHPDGFSYASQLVEFIHQMDGFSIGVAGYPEGHIEAPDLETDIHNLKKKVDAGSEFIITQLFFDNEDYYRFIDKTRAAGIDVPLVPGIMPVTNFSQIEKVTQMCAPKIPASLTEALEQCDSKETMCEAGIRYTINQCRELKEWGVPGFHFYTLNRSGVVSTILDAIM